LHHEGLASRMRPLADGIRAFPRLVRDLARELGKPARLEVAGESTGVDRDILDRLEAPLNHLIRNAIDHGIESPEERRAAGKPPVGTIRLEARHRAGMLQITLSDDGRGVDLDRLRARVVDRGLASAAMVPPLVTIAGEPYAFPLSRIDRILMLDRKDVRDLEGKPRVLLDDQLVGLVEATRVLELAGGDDYRAGELLPVVVASDRSHRFGVV